MAQSPFHIWVSALFIYSHSAHIVDMPPEIPFKRRLLKAIGRRQTPQPQLNQDQSLFFRLPQEIRNAIYLEVWRAAGLSQHIIYHKDQSHFCHWPCISDFSTEDDRQVALQEMRDRIPDSQIEKEPFQMPDSEWVSPLYSTWYNHWRCERKLFEALRAMGEDISELPTNNGPCRARATLSPYLPMLLSCKRMYEECSQSIYENTTFVFTDVETIQNFVGFCGQADVPHRPPKPFLQYTREIHVSVSPTLPALVPCSSQGTSQHTANDFHWLRLDRMANCKTVKIWIAAVHMETYQITMPASLPPISWLSTDDLRDALLPLGENGGIQISISTPLEKDIGPPRGVVRGLTQPNVCLWKRGSGDKFHLLGLTIQCYTQEFVDFGMHGGCKYPNKYRCSWVYRRRLLQMVGK
ncbi:hypothetical protein F4810DRAFT_684280 [Camillea tinctor]|nr:hypothetical protein F4810DRAFT_684280 [Camillea tinctor]